MGQEARPTKMPMAEASALLGQSKYFDCPQVGQSEEETLQKEDGTKDGRQTEREKRT